jgi:hypothetical protein
MDSYDNQVKTQLCKYKKNILKIPKPGFFRKKPYCHILPDESWEKNLWSQKKDQILDYAKHRRIHWHLGKAHLNSSQILCFNIFFPFIYNTKPLEPYFKKHVRGFYKFSGKMEFEYTDPLNLLNETRQTNVDLAIEWLDDCCNLNLFLLEFKYTEDSFGECSKYNKEKCRYLDTRNQSKKCYLTNKGIKYWDELTQNGPIKTESIVGKGACPFKSGLYQLMRNQLLAHMLEKTGRYKKVIFGVIYPERNKALERGVSAILTNGPKVAWCDLLNSPDRFLVILLDDLLTSVYEYSNDNLWKEFIKEKHGASLKLSSVS